SMAVTAVVGIVAFLMAINPPQLLIFLNLFAFGGLEAAFVWPLVLGLYWKYANKYGAILSMVTGIASYIVLHFYNEANGELLGVHTVTLPVVFSLVVFILGSLLIKRQVYTFPSAKSVNQPSNRFIKNWFTDHTIRENIRRWLLCLNKIKTEIKIKVNRKTLPRNMIHVQNMKPKQHQKINFQMDKAK